MLLFRSWLSLITLSISLSVLSVDPLFTNISSALLLLNGIFKNSWYKKRVDFLVLYFNASKINCLNNNKPIKLKTAKTLFDVKKQIAILSKKMKDIIKGSINL